MIEIHLNNVWSRIRNLKDVKTIDILDKETSFYVEGYQYTKAFKTGWFKDGEWRHWDGKKHLINNSMVFPTGLLGRIENKLKELKKEFKVVDKRPNIKYGEGKDLHFKPRYYQDEAADIAYSKGGGLIRIGTGGGKCARIGTKVIKYDGTICKVEELNPGDLLMGPDSKPRTVLSTNIQYGDIYKINPTRGDAWYCNDVHILTLKHTVTNEIIDIPLDEYLKKNKKFKHYYKQFSVGVNFNNNKELEIDPYFFGIWFGDGTKTISKTASNKKQLSNIEVTTMDSEVVSKLQKIAVVNNCRLNRKQYGDRCPSYSIVANSKEKSYLLNKMRKVLDHNLKTPKEYLTSSRKNRLEFLAGWIDSDGHLHNNCYEISQKRKDWTDDIAFLARSLGFKVIVSEKWNKQFEKMYYRIGISGNVSEIPVKIERKKASKRRQKKDACRTGFKIEPNGQDYYVGIELDQDGRFLLGDFTVTHNTYLAAQMAAKFDVPTMIYVVGKDLLYQTHEAVEEALNEEVGIIGDGQCIIRKFNVCSVWTAITSFNLKMQISLDDEDWIPEVKPASIEKERIRKAVQNCQMAIFDEAQYLACDTVQQIYKASKKCQHIFGLSGTDWRDDGADLLLESVCGPRIYSLTSSELINGGYLVPPKISMVNMPKMPGLPAKWPSVYSKYITNNDIRNQAIINASTKLYEMDRKILVLVRYIKHGNILNKELNKSFKTYFVNGNIDGKTRQNVKKEFESGNLDCLIASSVFDIGIDIPCLDGLILAGGGKSTVRCLQRVGRVIRNYPGKKDAFIYDPIDNARYVKDHSLIRANMYLGEPEFQVKLPKNFNMDSPEMKKIRAKLKKSGKIAK